MGSICCKGKKKARKKIVLLLVGLDNAGKTVAAKGLAGERLNSPVPTIGFSVIDLVYSTFDIKIYDLGGGPTIRGIWHKYFVDAHGIIFVIDSTDFERFPEVKFALQEMVYHEKVSGKPLLILANKQDQDLALDEIDIIEYLQIESLVNQYKCPTLVQSCSASELNNSNDKIDPGIKNGYEWLLNYIIRNYEKLDERVTTDVVDQVTKEKAELQERIERIKSVRAVELKRIQEQDGIQSYDEYAASTKELNNGTSKLASETTENKHVDNVFVVKQDTLSSNNSSSDDNSSFPSMYYGNVKSEIYCVQRPRSATEVVKKQLQLAIDDGFVGNTARVLPKRSVDKNSKSNNVSNSNKVAPIILFDVTEENGKKEIRKKPSSARERRRDFAEVRRFLKSADQVRNNSSVFVIDEDIKTSIANSFQNENYVGPSGDAPKELFRLNNFEMILQKKSLNQNGRGGIIEVQPNNRQ